MTAGTHAGMENMQTPPKDLNRGYSCCDLTVLHSVGQLYSLLCLFIQYFWEMQENIFQTGVPILQRSKEDYDIPYFIFCSQDL